MPRHICPDDQAFLTLPPSTSMSMRRWPSIRVMGSIVMRLAHGASPSVGRGGQATARIGKRLTMSDVAEHLERDEADGDQDLGALGK